MPVTIICESCGEPFQVRPSFAKGRRFCSMECRKKLTHETVTCKQCGKQFDSLKSLNRQFCSPSCSTTWRNLTDWNPSYHRDITGPNNPMWGKPGLRGKDNPMWGKFGAENPAFKGGIKVRPDGYIMRLAPEGHPARAAAYPYVLEHRLVMEEHLGRFLEPEEVVHHIDGDPSNNALDNLQLFANQSEHISKGHG